MTADFEAFQRKVNRWQAKTFPESTIKTVLKHLTREVRELRKTNDPEEAADCLMLLIAFCGKKGVSLFKEVQAKFRICKKRKWGEPDADGVREHVRDEKPKGKR